MSGRQHQKHTSTTSSPARTPRRAWVLALVGVGICAALAGVVWAFARPASVAEYGYEVVNVYPHDQNAYTQGLVYDNGELIEGTGLEKLSQLRRVDIATGKVRRVVRLPKHLFGEGVAVLGDRVYQLTWKSGTGFIYDRKTFKRLGEFRYEGEGWGLTTDGRYLIMSDGTPLVRYFDPRTFEEVGKIRVTHNGRTIKAINELEFIDGEIFANLWKEDRIARISPTTGQIVGWIYLDGLLPAKDRARLKKNMVLNGIAYDAVGRRLFVTGKNWPKLFEIKLVKKG